MSNNELMSHDDLISHFKNHRVLAKVLNVSKSQALKLFSGHNRLSTQATELLMIKLGIELEQTNQ